MYACVHYILHHEYMLMVMLFVYKHTGPRPPPINTNAVASDERTPSPVKPAPQGSAHGVNTSSESAARSGRRKPKYYQGLSSHSSEGVVR
jgi:hypothetical protein